MSSLGVTGLMTGEVLCEFIPVLPASVLYRKNWVTSKLFVSGCVDDIWKGLTYVSPSKLSLHLAVERVGQNAETVLCNYFYFVRMLTPIFHQSK